MTLPRALFGSAKTDWETPPDLFSLLDREFCFTLDVCATRANRKCPAYFTRAQDALRRRWVGTCWMNPPYGRAIVAWVAKARREARHGTTVVGLLPARTDTAWWQDTVMRAREIRLLRGRIRFVGAAAPAPFPSAVVIFKTIPSSRLAPRVVAWNWQRRADLTRTSGRRAARTPAVAA
jgi:site-specific DNA-methyltransferase (adenine-specific)